MSLAAVPLLPFFSFFFFGGGDAFNSILFEFYNNAIFFLSQAILGNIKLCLFGV
jgi:hypothetical protein